MEFKDRLKIELKKRGLTQSNFADMTNISKPVVSNYINGKHLPAASELVIISQTLNVSIDFLLGSVRHEEKTIYLSGNLNLIEGYSCRFKQAEAKLKAMYPNSIICNPKEEMKGYRARPDEQVMLTRSLLKKCDTIYMLNGWKENLEATAEFNYAYSNEYEIINYEGI